MPVTVSARCNACKGYGYTYWMHNDVPWTQPCQTCNGAGRVDVSVRTLDDSLDDVWRDYGTGNVVAETYANSHPDSASDSDGYTCLDCLAHTDDYSKANYFHRPCPEHAAAGSARRIRLDHDRGAGSRAAEACSQGLRDKGAGPDAADVRASAGGPVRPEPGASMRHRPSGEGLIEYSDSMNQGLEQWSDWATKRPTVVKERTINVRLKREGRVILPLVYEDE